MSDVPRIPDDLYRQLSRGDREIVRHLEVLRLITRAPTITERDGLADHADHALRRLPGLLRSNKQNPKRWGNLDRVFRLQGVADAIREVTSAVADPRSILYADRAERFLKMGSDIHDLWLFLGWGPGGPPSFNPPH
jgi:hypothetical protein